MPKKTHLQSTQEMGSQSQSVTKLAKLHFPSSAADYGKSLSSFFSSPSSTGSRAAGNYGNVQF